jgi:hypothetical protein
MATPSIFVSDSYPQTLTDTRGEVSTINPQSNIAELSYTEVIHPRPGFAELVVRSGSIVRRLQVHVDKMPGPGWLAPTLTNCSHLLLLSFDWDGRGAPPPEVTAIQGAFDALGLFMSDRSAPPQWTPTPKGGVQLDWHENGVDLEIEFASDRPDGYVVFGDLTNENVGWDGALVSNLHELRALFSGRLIDSNARAGR